MRPSLRAALMMGRLSCAIGPTAMHVEHRLLGCESVTSNFPTALGGITLVGSSVMVEVISTSVICATSCGEAMS